MIVSLWHVLAGFLIRVPQVRSLPGAPGNQMRLSLLGLNTMHPNQTHIKGNINIQTAVLLSLVVVGIMIILMLQLNETDTRPAPKSIMAKGVSAPDFTLPDLDGEMVRLSDYKGQVVLLNIWATWCPPCVEEMPSMEKLHQTLKNEGFVLLAVSVDNAGAKVVRPFMQSKKLSFPALLNPTASIQDLYHTTGVPESFIIDQQGIIVEKILGPRDWASPGAIQYFRRLMAQP